MKTVSVVLGLLLTAGQASAGLLDIPNLATLVAEKAKESRACGVVSFDGKVAGGAYLPVWVLHQKDEPKVQYLAAGIGGAIKQGEAFRPLITLGANLPALSARLWASDWANRHLTRTKFPPLWFGPHLRVPLPGERVGLQDWREWVGLIVSVGL